MTRALVLGASSDIGGAVAADVAAAVRFVVDFPRTGCPVEIELQLQSTP